MTFSPTFLSIIPFGTLSNFLYHSKIFRVISELKRCVKLYFKTNTVVVCFKDFKKKVGSHTLLSSPQNLLKKHHEPDEAEPVNQGPDDAEPVNQGPK